MRNVLAIVAFFGLSMTLVLAEEFGGMISKVEGNKITVKTRGKDKGAGEEKTLTVADNVKVFKGVFNGETKKFEKGDALADGLKSEVFSKGAFARITTDADNKVTEIIVGGGRKKKE